MTKKSNEELIKLAFEYVQKANEDAQKNPTSDSIQVVVVEPMKTPYKKTIPNELEQFQALVDGYIEILTIGHTETGGTIALTLNEEGKLKDLPLNKVIHGRGGSDVLVGTFFISAFNMQGDNISLNDADCDKLIKKFKGMEVYL
jgi:Domain of unknown function (DUF3846)